MSFAGTSRRNKSGNKLEDQIVQLYQALEDSSFTVAIIGATGCYANAYWDCRKRSAKIIQINPGRTHFDSVADLNIREGSDPVFEELMKLEEKAE